MCDEPNDDQIKLPLNPIDQLELLESIAEEIKSTTDFLEPQGWIA